MQLLENDDKNFLIFKYLSNIFLIEKDSKSAIEYAKKALASVDGIDNKTDVLENLAKIYSVSNDFQQAIDDLTLSRNKTLIIFLFGMLGITLITNLLIYI